MFFVIAFGVPWTGWIIERRTIGLDHLFDSFGLYWFTAAPSVAGFVAAAVDGTGIRRFADRVLNLRFAFWAWVLALFLPLTAALLTFAGHPLDLFHGGSPKVGAFIATASWTNFFTGPIAEEFGWRGYLLGRFCQKWRPIVAGFLIGPIWELWHLPLMYDTMFASVAPALSYVGWITAWSIVLALIVTWARGSVLPAILGHWCLNAAPAIFFALLPAVPGEHQPGGIIFSITSIALAVVIAWLGRNTKWSPQG